MKGSSETRWTSTFVPLEPFYRLCYTALSLCRDNHIRAHKFTIANFNSQSLRNLNPSVITSARNHFKKVDPKFYRAIRAIKVLDFDKHRSGDVYHDLIRAIMGQQLSVKAAEAIYHRFLELFDDGYPHSDVLQNLSDQDLRSKGVSRQKAGYVRNVAVHFQEQGMKTDDFLAMTNDEILDQLTTIKGVGVWTVQMMLMFTLQRPDVFAIDDLGIQKGIQAIYDVRHLKGKPLKAEMVKISQNWSPYRTVGCMYLWRYFDDQQST